jgi:hypothetical protein
MPFVIIGGILLILYSRGNAVQGSRQALGKRQQNVGYPGKRLATSTTCKGKGAIMMQTPTVAPPNNVPVPVGIVVSDDGQNIAVDTANAVSAQFLDVYGNVIGQVGLANGQRATYNYACCSLACGCGLACSSIDFTIANIVLQGPGGSTIVPNPYYTPASYRQSTGKLFTCGGDNAATLVPGTAFQDETAGYPAPVNRSSFFQLPSAAAVVSPNRP